MNAIAIKEKLHNYLDIADERKLRAIYVMVEDELRDTSPEYSDDFKAEIDRRVGHYLSGEEMVTAVDMSRRLGCKRPQKSSV